jgi:hypothetical protein
MGFRRIMAGDYQLALPVIRTHHGKIAGTLIASNCQLDLF